MSGEKNIFDKESSVHTQYEVNQEAQKKNFD